ncbi:GNAT family N-acetyltransferase [Solirhodobacter olei]|uniref:GNAT family N-acetyltransferase n=1 Tax=Solirhodobacter olei TaxID=2493082 RepID=UPI000FDC6AE2|nr:GNAT family N-acetyltransferase [Solirhodobacter olei]
MVPGIETERLALRGFELADFDRYAEIYTEPEVMHFLGGTPRSREESWGRFLKIAGSWPLLGYGQWAVTLRGSDRMLGQVGFMMALRGIGADFDAAPECGWVFAREAQGQGYGAEAVAAAHRWFDGQGFGGRSHVMIDVRHDASLRLAEKMGYREMRQAEYLGDPVVLLARERGAGAV